MKAVTVVLGLAAILCAGPALAEKPLNSLMRNRTGITSDYRELIRAPVPGALKGQPRTPRLATEPGSIPTYRGSNGEYQEMARAAARRHAIPEDLFLRLVHTESKFRPTAKSSKGAIGLAQLMPGTARVLGVNPHDPGQNLDGGARYLSQQYRRFGDWRLALAAYNAGPEAVARYKGVPPYRETQQYVKLILGR